MPATVPTAKAAIGLPGPDKRRLEMQLNRWVLIGVTALMALVLVGSAVVAKEEEKEGKEEVKAKVDLPEAAAKAVKEAFPKATIDEVEKNDEDGLILYDVELKDGDVAMDVEVAADGTLIKMSTEVAIKDVPAAAAQAIQKAAEGATIKEIEKAEIRAELKKDARGAASIVKLDKPRTVYEVELVKGDLKGEIEVAADGTVVEPIEWKAAKDKEDKDGKEEQEEGKAKVESKK
jgi:hypothetical protein